MRIVKFPFDHICLKNTKKGEMVLNRGVHKILRNFLILKDSRGEEVPWPDSNWRHTD